MNFLLDGSEIVPKLLRSDVTFPSCAEEHSSLRHGFHFTYCFGPHTVGQRHGDSNARECLGELVVRADPADVEWGSAPTAASTRSILQFCLALGDATFSAKAMVFVHSLDPPPA